MKIVNICVTGQYDENFSYQENLLTDYFRDSNIDTVIIASNLTPNTPGRKKYKLGEFDDNGKKLIRIKCFKISNDFVIQLGLWKKLTQEKPDIIFHHNLNFSSLIVSTIYKRLHRNTVFFADNHADYITRTKNKFWRFFYHGNILKTAVKLATPHIRKFYGVAPSRCDYLRDVFNIPKDKIFLLPLGTDTKAAESIKESKQKLREKYSLSSNSFIFISGGKMGKDKGTPDLINAVNELRNTDLADITLILFGSFTDKETEELTKEHSDSVIFKGWQDHLTVLELLKLSDAAVWSVRHTTLMEDAISVNTPLLVCKSRTTEHLIEGNGLFIEPSDYDNLLSTMRLFIENQTRSSYSEYCNAMREKLDYKNIVKRILIDARN